MNNWTSHWPNALFTDDAWHWMNDLQFSFRENVGNIEYGPQAFFLSELSHSMGQRNVFFFSAGVGTGTIHERVTFIQSRTTWYAGKLSTGLRRSLGKTGRSWSQVKITAPSTTYYVEADFPFSSQETVKGELLLLQNLPLPWSHNHPGLLNTLYISGLYQKNIGRDNDTLSDDVLLLHVSSAIHTFQPLFIGTFLQFRTEQLLLPPSIWTTERETRLLSIASAGLDLAMTRPGWELIKLRVGFPIWSRSSSNGFPDGTQPTAYFNVAFNLNGTFNSE